MYWNRYKCFCKGVGALLEFINNLDFSVLYWVQEHLRCGFLDGLCSILSVAFEGGVGWFVICAVLLCFRKTRVVGVVMGISILLAFFVGELCMKNIFCRVRPCNQDLSVALAIKRPTAYSFPSGHTGSSFAAAMAIFLWNKKWGMPALIFASVMGLSRLYLFVHFPTDVLAGAVLGILCALTVWLVFKKYKIDDKINRLGIKTV